jgi:hypothetical protein
VLLIAIDHKLQIDYRQTLGKNETNNRIPLITTPIDKGENTFTALWPFEHHGSVQQSFIHHPCVLTDT